MTDRPASESGPGRRAARALGLLAAGLLVVGVLLAAVNFPATQRNGLSLSRDGGPPTAISWLWLDAVSVDPGDQAAVAGYLWNGTPGSRHFEVTSDGGLEIRLDDRIVYSRPDKSSLASHSFTADLPAGAVPIAVSYRAASPRLPRFEVSLREDGRLIGPWRLYQAEPAPALVGRQRWAWAGLQAGLALVALGAVCAVGLGLRSLQLTRPEALGGFAIVGVAIAARLIVVAERYQAVPDFYAMESVWDNFVGLARQTLVGGYDLAGSYYQQGAILYSALSQIVLGPGLLGQYVLNAALGGLACGAVMAAAWSCFGRGTGLVAGAMMALYAPMIHFQTTLQIVVPATLAAAGAVAFGAWLLRRPGWVPAVGYGVAVGLGVLSRSTLLALSPGGLLAAILTSAPVRARSRLIAGGLTLLSAGLTVLPMAVANARVGVYSVSSSGFAVAFFRGNNRDTFGINEYFTERELLARRRSGDEDNFNAETLRDIRADPGHWVQLMLHKAALFWTGHEYSDRQLDFYSTGLGGSRLLRWLWLGGAYSLATLSGLAALGAYFALRDSTTRPAGLFLASLPLAFMALTILFSVTGRVRTPIQPALFPLAAFGAVGLAKGLWRGSSALRAMAAPIAAVLVWLLLVHYLETALPRPTTVSRDRLPATMVGTNVDFDSKLRLVGFDALDSDFRSDGYLDLTLYWEALAPLESDYVAYIHLLNPSLQRLGGVDRPLGAANYPVYPSSRWKVGEIVRQSYFLPLPTIEGAVPIRIIVGVYGADQARLPARAGAVEVLGETAAVVTGLSILPQPMPRAAELPRTLGVTAGPELRITGTDLPAAADLGPAPSELDLRLGWQARAHPPYRYHLFLHLFDARGDLVAQFDGPPVAEFPTDTWPPGSAWSGRYRLTLPSPLPPGDYQLVAGLYQLGTRERLAILAPPDLLLPDNRFMLSKVRVTP